MFRLFPIGLVCTTLLAQTGEPSPETTAPFRTSTDLVVAPVTVLDRDGAYINGIEPERFHLYDNGKEQNIQVDLGYQPISLVIAIQSNWSVQSILPQVRKIGGMITPLVIGDRGRAAVIAFDSRIRKLQDFTSNPDAISRAVKEIMPGGTSNRLVDAVEEGTRMLDTQPKNRRRILLVIGETRDLGSEMRARETLIGLQLANVALYAADMSRLLSTFTAPPVQPRWVQAPPASFPPLVAGYPRTPTTVDQAFGLEGHAAQFVPLMVELFKDAKAIANDNPIELFTKGTGGSEFSFYKLRGLENAIQEIGEELHSQYLISYNPNNREEGGFHEISVAVSGRTDIAKIQTRPGYWIAARPK